MTHAEASAIATRLRRDGFERAQMDDVIQVFEHGELATGDDAALTSAIIQALAEGGYL